MGDIRIVWDPTTGTGDLNMLGSGLELGFDLETASLISMFTDARSDPGDMVYDTTNAVFSGTANYSGHGTNDLF